MPEVPPSCFRCLQMPSACNSLHLSSAFTHGLSDAGSPSKSSGRHALALGIEGLRARERQTKKERRNMQIRRNKHDGQSEERKGGEEINAYTLGQNRSSCCGL